MAQSLDYVIITPLPVFYKVNLYNELAKSLKIFVVFLASETKEKRAGDFTGLKNAHFEHTTLFAGNLQERPLWKNSYQLVQILRQKSYKWLLVGGWDCLEFWAGVLASSKAQNAIVVESSIYESATRGVKAWLKRFFLKRISKAFVCSHRHAKLLEVLGFKGELKITQGVGIIHKPLLCRNKRSYTKNFICVARLSGVKNLEFLLRVFHNLPNFSLSLVGIGELESPLKQMASPNVAFLGAIENAQLTPLLCAFDGLILPSLSEPWGLVVEEALAVGLPVFVSVACGAHVLVQEGVNGFIFDPKDVVGLIGLLEGLSPAGYQTLLEGALAWDLEAKDNKQVQAYVL
ncbi:glycosyltransferase family 4 protein [Helicobacter bizzozeronii]|uniref:glycosyltransferase family 4 protein n=1 Tax=Helicobacter bizzozeronii TaxID=56877 RepID=UPI000CEEE413|nr:glycosyltransferase family 4 protein [Helicobacter bizzozeronii]